MASGRPVIVSDRVGCAKDLVTANNGFIFSYHSATHLQAILETLSSETLLKLGNNAKKLTETHNFEIIVTAIEEEFNNF